MTTPRIFIASPLFNPEQIAIIEKIEELLTKAGYTYYSARKHSGSDRLTTEQKRSLKNWDPVFESNVQGLDECTVMIAVLEYALPEKQRLSLVVDEEDMERGTAINEITTLELPDAGTVWEMGYHKAQNKIVIGFHTDRAKHLNLMLTHGCDAMVKGFDQLEEFLTHPLHDVEPPRSIATALKKCVDNRWHDKHTEIETNAGLFNWDATAQFDAAEKEVE